MHSPVSKSLCSIPSVQCQELNSQQPQSSLKALDKDVQCRLHKFLSSNSLIQFAESRPDAQRSRSRFQCPVSNSQCPVSSFQCPVSKIHIPVYCNRHAMYSAQFSMSKIECAMSRVQCPVSSTESSVQYSLPSGQCPKSIV